MTLVVKRALMFGATIAGIAVIVVFDPRQEAKILLAAMMTICTVFVLWYNLFSPWRVTAGGKALMYTTLAMALLCAQLSSVWWFGNYAGRDEVRSGLLLALVLSFLYRLLLLPGYQALDRKSRRQRYTDAKQAIADLEAEEDRR